MGRPSKKHVYPPSLSLSLSLSLFLSLSLSLSLCLSFSLSLVLSFSLSLSPYLSLSLSLSLPSLSLSLSFSLDLPLFWSVCQLHYDEHSDQDFNTHDCSVVAAASSHCAGYHTHTVGNPVVAFLRYKGKKKNPRPALSSLNLGLLGLPW